jgi:hypothetical protein
MGYSGRRVSRRHSWRSNNGTSFKFGSIEVETEKNWSNKFQIFTSERRIYIEFQSGPFSSIWIE